MGVQDAADTLKDTVEKAEAVKVGLDAFRDNGDAEALTSALLAILDVVAKSEKISDEAKNFIEALEGIINATGKYWGAIKNADDRAEAAETLYEDLKAAAIVALGEDSLTAEQEFLIVALDS